MHFHVITSHRCPPPRLLVIQSAQRYCTRCDTSPAFSQVPHPRVQVRSPGPAGGGGPETPQHNGGRALGRQGGAGLPPTGADGGGAEETASSAAAAPVQRRQTVPHQPGDVLGSGARGDEVRLPGAPLLQHSGRRRDPRRAQGQKPLQLIGLLSQQVWWDGKKGPQESKKTNTYWRQSFCVEPFYL